jgi:hypothetical protein
MALRSDALAFKTRKGSQMNRKALQPRSLLAASALAASLVFIVFGEKATAQIHINQVTLGCDEIYQNGVDANQYWYEIQVNGSGINSVQVTSPDGVGSWNLVPDGNTWYGDPAGPGAAAMARTRSLSSSRSMTLTSRTCTPSEPAATTQPWEG